MKSKNILNISITENSLKVVHVKGSGKAAKIVNLAIRDTNDVDDQQLTKIIQDTLKAFNVGKADVIYTAPTSTITTKNIEVPSSNEDEIKSIVNLQAARHTPLAREEIQVGHIKIGGQSGNHSKILLVIANRVALKNQLNIIERSGLKVKEVHFAPEAIASFYSDFKKFPSKTAPVGIIDLNKTSTAFHIVVNGVIIATRSINIGRVQIAQEGIEARDRLVDELRQTVEAYVSEEIDQQPAQYVITSDDNHCTDLQQVLQEKLSWQVSIIYYADVANVAKTFAKKISVDYAEHSFLDVIATATRASTAQINLIPEDIQLQKSVEEQGKEVFKATILAVISLVLVFAVFSVKMYFKEANLRRLVAENEDNRKRVELLDKKSNRIKVVGQYVKSRMISLDILNELYRYIPKEVYLTSIVVDDEGIISVQGISEVGSIVYNLNTKLRDSQLFSSADVKSKSAKKDRGKDAHAFEIVLKTEFTKEAQTVESEEE